MAGWGGRQQGLVERQALETELCELLNAGHKLPAFCFRETMRNLIQRDKDWVGVVLQGMEERCSYFSSTS